MARSVPIAKTTMTTVVLTILITFIQTLAGASPRVKIGSLCLIPQVLISRRSLRLSNLSWVSLIVAHKGKVR